VQLDQAQVAVDTEHHLIVTHEVTDVGSDRSQLARVSELAQTNEQRLEAMRANIETSSAR
jgi:hypothetical protein